MKWLWRLIDRLIEAAGVEEEPTPLSRPQPKEKPPASEPEPLSVEDAPDPPAHLHWDHQSEG